MTIHRLEGTSKYLDTPLSDRKNAIMKCAYVAFLKGFTVFGVKDGGECYSGMWVFYIPRFCWPVTDQVRWTFAPFPPIPNKSDSPLNPIQTYLSDTMKKKDIVPVYKGQNW